MFLFIVLTVLNIFGTGCQSENVTMSIDKSAVKLGSNVTLTCTYYGNRTESGILWFNGSDPTGLLYLPGCTQFSAPSSFYDTGRIFPTCNPSSKIYTLTITVTSYDFETEWCCSFILTPDIRCSSNKRITPEALTTTPTPTATTTTTVKETNVTSASASSTINTTANTGENDSHQLVIIISVSVGAIVLVTVIIIIIIICCHKRKKGQTKHKAHHDIARNGSNSTNERNELQKVPKTKSDKGNSNVQNQSSTRI